MSLTPPPDAVVFDFDGPIIDSREPVRIALRAALREHGYRPRSDVDLDSAIGPPTLEGLAQLTGEPEHDLTALADTYHDHYAAVYLAHTRLVDGIVDVLHALSMPLALATAKQIEFTEPLLDALGIRRLLRRRVCARVGRPGRIKVGDGGPGSRPVGSGQSRRRGRPTV